MLFSGTPTNDRSPVLGSPVLGSPPVSRGFNFNLVNNVEDSNKKAICDQAISMIKNQEIDQHLHGFRENYENFEEVKRESNANPDNTIFIDKKNGKIIINENIDF